MATKSDSKVRAAIRELVRNMKPAFADPCHSARYAWRHYTDGRLGLRVEETALAFGATPEQAAACGEAAEARRHYARERIAARPRPNVYCVFKGMATRLGRDLAFPPLAHLYVAGVKVKAPRSKFAASLLRTEIGLRVG